MSAPRPDGTPPPATGGAPATPLASTDAPSDTFGTGSAAESGALRATRRTPASSDTFGTDSAPESRALRATRRNPAPSDTFGTGQAPDSGALRATRRARADGRAVSAGEVRVTFDGAEVVGEPGQSVGAALVAAGITAWRTTRRERRARGIFCGIGVCHDCLLTVDGAPNQRACLVPLADGMVLESGDGNA